MAEKKRSGEGVSTPRRRLIGWGVVVIIILGVMANLGAVIDVLLHPEIEYFDSEHLIVGFSTVFVVGGMLALLILYVERLNNTLFYVKQTERSLRVKEWAIESSITAIAITDLAGTLNYVNPAFLKLWGYASLAEAMGRPATAFWKADEKAAELQQMLRVQGRWSGELEAEKKDGSPFVVEVAASVVADSDGTRVSMLGSFMDITERKRAEESLRRSLEEKQVLLREVHHRVKNNLTVISSLLNLQSSAIRTPEQAMAAFKNSRDRVMAMALVHKELYESKDYARVDMNTYLGKLIRQIVVAYGAEPKVRMATQVEEISLGVDYAIPCGLIVNELITNAIKHAFPDGRAGEIRIAFGAVGDDTIELSVADDGIGLPEGGVLEETLGHALVRLLAEQLEGSMECTSNNGTRCLVRFPGKGKYV